MSRILVTGGAGFLGQYLLEALAREGHEVDVIDLKPSQHPVHDIRPFCRRITYGVDITNLTQLRKHFPAVDMVYHLAGVVSFWKKHARLLHEVNVEGTRNVLQAAQAAGVPNIIHVSSVAAVGYGDTAEPIDEEYCFDWSNVPRKHYMLTKHLSEDEVRQVSRKGMRVIIVNPGLMWGPGDMLNSSKLIVGLQRGNIPACPPGGTNIIDVRDVAAGLLLAAKHGRTGNRYILGGHNITFRQAYDVISNTLHIPAPRRMLPHTLKPFLHAIASLNESLRKSPPPLTADQVDSSFRFRYFSSEKAKRELGWELRRPFKEMIQDSVTWLRSRHFLP